MFWKKKANVSQDTIEWNNCIPLKKTTVWCWLYLLIEKLLFILFFCIVDKLLVNCAFEKKEQYGSVYYNIHGETTVVFAYISIIGMILILILSIVLAFIIMKKVIVNQIFSTIKKQIEEKKDLNIDKDTIYRKEHTIITFVLYIIRFILSLFIMACLLESIIMIYQQVIYLLSKYFVGGYYLYESKEIDPSQYSNQIKMVLDNAKDIYFSLPIKNSSYYNWLKLYGERYWYFSIIYFILVPLMAVSNYIIKYIQVDICPSCRIIDGFYTIIERGYDDVKENTVYRTETKGAHIDNEKSVLNGMKVNINVTSKYNVATFMGHYIIKCKHCGQRTYIKFKHKEEQKIGEEIQ